MAFIQESGYDTWRSANALEKILRKFESQESPLALETSTGYQIKLVYPKQFLLDEQRAHFRKIVKKAIIDYILLNDINPKNAKIHLMKLQAQFDDVNSNVGEDILPLQFTQSIFLEAGLIDHISPAIKKGNHYVQD